VEGEGEEMVILIAGGMSSQLTYDGIDVCASRVAFEVGPLFALFYYLLCRELWEKADM
jgi:hypothetical protein